MDAAYINNWLFYHEMYWVMAFEKLVYVAQCVLLLKSSPGTCWVLLRLVGPRALTNKIVAGRQKHLLKLFGERFDDQLGLKTSGDESLVIEFSWMLRCY